MSEPLELTEAERAALTPEQRRLVDEVEAVHDPVDDDRRYAGLVYDDVLDADGRSVHRAWGDRG